MTRQSSRIQKDRAKFTFLVIPTVQLCIGKPWIQGDDLVVALDPITRFRNTTWSK
jgi:hypothetical protein